MLLAFLGKFLGKLRRSVPFNQGPVSNLHEEADQETVVQIGPKDECNRTFAGAWVIVLKVNHHEILARFSRFIEAYP